LETGSDASRGDGVHSASSDVRRIAEIRFRAKGCVPAMACGSAITELLQGKSLDEARRSAGKISSAKSEACPRPPTMPVTSRSTRWPRSCGICKMPRILRLRH
jgi:hypothetical protein